ncbi:MAG: hypothetical protein QM755_04490 [Luteolibacter sp.]
MNRVTSDPPSAESIDPASGKHVKVGIVPTRGLLIGSTLLSTLTVFTAGFALYVAFAGASGTSRYTFIALGVALVLIVLGLPGLRAWKNGAQSSAAWGRNERVQARAKAADAREFQHSNDRLFGLLDHHRDTRDVPDGE